MVFGYMKYDLPILVEAAGGVALDFARPPFVAVPCRPFEGWIGRIDTDSLVAGDLQRPAAHSTHERPEQ